MLPFILLSNDDGWQAPGMQALIDILRPVAELLVVAPDGPRSGYSCAITTQTHLTLRTVREEEGLTVIACSGSPVDSVKAAFNIVLPKRYGYAADGYTAARLPDLVVSGINYGENASVNTYYSGTMGCVTEGTFQGVPSIGLSLNCQRADDDYMVCARWTREIIDRVLRDGLPPLTCLNVNFPDPTLPAVTANGGEFLGMRFCRMARSRWIHELTESVRPGGHRPIYWITGEVLELEPDAEDTDRWAMYHGYVAVTPQRLDVTDYELLKSWQA